jgi:hypothetical protein
MIALFWLFLAVSVSPFKSKNRLAAENAALRHQLIVLQRRVRGRVQLTNGDRLFLVTLYRWFPSVLKAITIVRPETLVRWHRAGFRRYWRWKSRSLGGRPKIDADVRALIRRMSAENPLWGAPRIHGELLKLGFEVAQSSVAKYMVKRCSPPSQGWRTFLRNHAPDIAAMDLFVAPTIGFDLLYAFIIVGLAVGAEPPARQSAHGGRSKTLKGTIRLPFGACAKSASARSISPASLTSIGCSSTPNDGAAGLHCGELADAGDRRLAQHRCEAD